IVGAVRREISRRRGRIAEAGTVINLILIVGVVRALEENVGVGGKLVVETQARVARSRLVADVAGTENARERSGVGIQVSLRKIVEQAARARLVLCGRGDAAIQIHRDAEVSV